MNFAVVLDLNIEYHGDIQKKPHTIYNRKVNER